MLLSRRMLLLSGAAAVTVAGCSTLSNWTTITQQAVTALQAIAAEITQIIPQLVSAGLGGNTLTAVQNIVTEIQSVLSGVTTAITNGQGQSILIQVEDLINQLAPLVLPFLSAIPGGSIIGMIVAALPAIEALVGVAITALTNLAQSLASSAPAVTSSRYRGRLRKAVPSQAYLQMLEAAAAAR